MFDLEAFVESCRRVIAEPHAAKAILELMREAVADPDAVAQGVPALPPKTGVLDAPIFRSSEMTVLNVTLRPHACSIAHNHRMWAVIGIYKGEEANTFYRRGEKRLEAANRRTIHAGEALLLGADVVHAIENPLDTPTLGLHVYGGDLLGAERSMWSPDEKDERAYELPQFYHWCNDLAAARRAERERAAAAG
ncbi:MAG TPA: hypothetical protein VKT30_00995 [Caulobacteraceae bacterium]|nr:hypothetical protein [Caulobacteraceae bacterium]